MHHQYTENQTMRLVQIGGVFPRIGDTQASTIRRQPVLFFVCVNQVSAYLDHAAVHWRPSVCRLPFCRLVVYALREGTALLVHVLLQGVFAGLVLINSFPSERMLSLRERAAGGGGRGCGAGGARDGEGGGMCGATSAFCSAAQTHETSLRLLRQKVHAAVTSIPDCAYLCASSVCCPVSASQ
jgi:hypothetical protein